MRINSFADSLTIFGGILSGPIVFFGLFLIISFTSSIFAVGMSFLIAGESMCLLIFRPHVVDLSF